MISGQQMSDLIKLGEQHGARIVFSGDTRQIQSVDAGDALRVLETESRLKSVSLTEVQRQAPRDYREAIEELRRNPEGGFAKLERIGAVREVAENERAESISREYAEGPSANVLVVCATHTEIDRVTEAIRSDRKRRGALGESVQTSREISLNWTTAQKQEMRNFRPGQLLSFHRQVKGIAKHETVEVVKVAGNALTVRNDRSEKRRVTARHAKSFDVVERRGIEVAEGDRLLLTANRRDPEFRSSNGEIVTVSSVDERGRIQLQDGRTLPGNFRQFAHGYAVTAHRSQGKTVDSVIVFGDGMPKELFYVAASRGRRSIMVVTSDRERLRQSLARTSARKSATELARRRQTCVRRGEHRGWAAARDIVRRVRAYVRALPTRISQQETAQQTGRERTHEYGFGR
jgi:ATP-dependent exoDNAse (exonuclease V) alpha subunit